ncbi:MAG: hypothetical protein ABIF04_07875 [Chloroflexota bacterium]
MGQRDADIRFLTGSLIDEIVNAVGLPKTPVARWTFGLFFRRVAERLATLGVTADRMIATDGFPSAAGWMMSHWVKNVTGRGAETIPAAGPLLIIANHCGAYDFTVIPSQLVRTDIKIISSDILFLKNLPNACKHLIFATNDTNNRMAAVRAGIRHLQAGGALLLFGTGLIDPDPAVYPYAEKEIENWSPSIDIFLRQVPETKVLATIVSGIISPKWAYHPITRLRKIDWQKRRLAEFGQVIWQLFFPERLYVSPSISFDSPVTVEALRDESDSGRLLPAIVSRGKSLLVKHIEWIQKAQEE